MDFIGICVVILMEDSFPEGWRRWLRREVGDPRDKSMNFVAHLAVIKSISLLCIIYSVIKG